MIRYASMAEKIPICIDGRLRAADETGVASYGHAVVEALEAVGNSPFILTDDAKGRFGVANGRSAVAIRALRAIMPYPVQLHRNADQQTLFADDIYRMAQARFRRTGRLLHLRVDGPPGVMHWTYPIPARIDGWSNVYTVHDVIPLTDPHLSPIDPAGLRARIVRVAKTGDRIVTVSPWAKRSIIDTLGLAPDRVTDCGGCVARMTPGEAALPAQLEAKRYFLYCGLLEPRKNVERLVAGWRASRVDLPLIVTGPHKTADASLRAKLVAQGVIVLPYQARSALVDLMQGARALTFPTLEEGFGLPIIEAMTLGTPVMTSAQSAMVDTAGGAALLVDPNCVDAIAEGFRQLQDNDDLCTKLSIRGLVRAKAFSASAFGNRLTALYADLAGV